MIRDFDSTNDNVCLSLYAYVGVMCNMKILPSMESNVDFGFPRATIYLFYYNQKIFTKNK